MSNSKHTQGEWKIVESKYQTAIVSDNIMVASVPILHEDKEANAKLIAAAPELLECLNKLTNCIQGTKNGSLILIVPIELSEKIGETIEKAGGKNE